MTTKKTNYIQPDWWSKTFVGAVLGFTFAFALAGIFAWAGPGGISAANKTQFVMWMIAPVWAISFSMVYLFRSGVQSLGWFSVANVIAYMFLFSLNGFLTA